MYRALLILFCFIALHASSQDITSVIGRWQVVVADNGVRYDYKTDTYQVSKALMDSLQKDKSTIYDLEFYVSSAAGCRECYFVFEKDGSYAEYRGTELRLKGTYTVTPGDSLISLIISVNEKQIPKKYPYQLKGDRLILRVPSYFHKEGWILELERRK